MSLRKLLAPGALFYATAVSLRNLLYDAGLMRVDHVDVPVIAVGNITSGGSGKTPCVMTVIEILLRAGKRPAVISRGYGRTSAGLRVVSDGGGNFASVDESGDEPLLIAHAFPGTIVIVAERRIDAARKGMAMGADCLIADDAFQHRALGRTLDIVMAGDELARASNPLLPSGDGREPLRSLRRANVVVSLASAEAETRTHLSRHSTAELLFADILATDLRDPLTDRRCTLTDLNGRSVVLLTGIAHPERVAATVSEAGARIVASCEFPDHHWFTTADLRAAADFARTHGAAIITTEKDWIRLAASSDLSVVFGGLELRTIHVALRLRHDGVRFEQIIRSASNCPASNS